MKVRVQLRLDPDIAFALDMASDLNPNGGVDRSATVTAALIAYLKLTPVGGDDAGEVGG